MIRTLEPHLPVPKSTVNELEVPENGT